MVVNALLHIPGTFEISSMWCANKLRKSIFKITLFSLPTSLKSNNFTPSIISPIFSQFPNLSTISQNFRPAKPVAVSLQSNQKMSSNTTDTSDVSEFNYSESDIAEKFIFFNVLKDGRVHILHPSPKKISPYNSDSVFSKDVEISADVSARIFLPASAAASASTAGKLPLLLYVHGGGFCMQSAFNEEYTRFVSQMAAEANIIGVSVEYGLFPARPISACYEDSWTALQWVASHANGAGPEPWINDHADLNRIFVGGDSAGGNISHTLLARVGSSGLPGDAKVEGMILVHPYFGEDDKMWMYMCPTNQGPQDPRMKPAVEDLAKIGCERVLVLLAEKDGLYGAGKMYADELVKSGWKGRLEIMESKDRDHCFHIGDHTDLEAVAIRKRFASFINH